MLIVVDFHINRFGEYCADWYQWKSKKNSDRRPWEGCGNSVQLALSSTQWINYVANVDEAVTGHQYVHRHHEECQTEGGETSERLEYRMMTFMLSSNIVYP